MIQCPNATQKSGMSSAPPRQRARPIPNFHPQRPQGREFSQVVFLATNDNTLSENEQLKHLKRWRIPKGKDHRLPLPAIFRCENANFREGIQKRGFVRMPTFEPSGFFWTPTDLYPTDPGYRTKFVENTHGFVEGG